MAEEAVDCHGGEQKRAVEAWEAMECRIVKKRTGSGESRRMRTSPL